MTGKKNVISNIGFTEVDVIKLEEYNRRALPLFHAHVRTSLCVCVCVCACVRVCVCVCVCVCV